MDGHHEQREDKASSGQSISADGEIAALREALAAVEDYISKSREFDRIDLVYKPESDNPEGFRYGDWAGAGMARDVAWLAMIELVRDALSGERAAQLGALLAAVGKWANETKENGEPVFMTKVELDLVDAYRAAYPPAGDGPPPAGAAPEAGA